MTFAELNSCCSENKPPSFNKSGFVETLDVIGARGERVLGGPALRLSPEGSGQAG